MYFAKRTEVEGADVSNQLIHEYDISNQDDPKPLDLEVPVTNWTQEPTIPLGQCTQSLRFRQCPEI